MKKITTIFICVCALTLSACQVAGPIAEGRYRLPYANGVEVIVGQDDETHGSPAKNMFDLLGTEPNHVLVAAASGWVRFIEDDNDVGGNANNNYIWIEHPLNYCQPPAPGSVGQTDTSGCKTCPQGIGKCNEWSLTVHMRQNSITAAAPLGAGLSVNQWIEEGVPIGIEGAVGYVVIGTGRCTDADFANNPLCGRHAHFNVFVFDTDAFTAQGLPTVNGDYETFAIALPERPERVPIYCTQAGLRFIEKGEVHIAAPCPSSE